MPRCRDNGSFHRAPNNLSGMERSSIPGRLLLMNTIMPTRAFCTEGTFLPMTLTTRPLVSMALLSSPASRQPTLMWPCEKTPVPACYRPRCRSALRNGASESLIRPSAGRSSSRIRKIAPATDRAHRSKTATTVALGGENRPKLTKITVSQKTRITRNGVGTEVSARCSRSSHRASSMSARDLQGP